MGIPSKGGYIQGAYRDAQEALNELGRLRDEYGADVQGRFDLDGQTVLGYYGYIEALTFSDGSALGDYSEREVLTW